MKNKIAELFLKYNLGKVEADILPISGGLMHKMYKVQTSLGTYAVKVLNPEIMKRPDAAKNYERAEKLERLLETAGLPLVPALAFGGKKMLELDGDFFYIFKWQEGSITDWKTITKEQCFIAGELLGRIHKIDAQNVESQPAEECNIDFEAYIKAAAGKNGGAAIASLLSENLPLLQAAQTQLNQARKKLPPMKAITDDDMDPKNVMWYKGQPHIIDLECLDYENPLSSCLNLALQWSGTVNQSFNKENLAAFFDGYLKAYDNGFRSYDELFGIAYSWLEWLEYNIRRGLGLEASSEQEIKLGQEEVKNTIERIKYLTQIEAEVRCCLSKLPPPDSKNYKTHDNSLCYIDLVFEGELKDLPHYELPEGFSFVSYKSGDKDAWINIELSSEEVLNYEHGQECWQRYYGNKENELYDRMFFIENSKSQKVATATAFYDIHENDKPEQGQLHWVAIKKEAQGKGLSKPLITHVLQIMKNLGYTSVKIHTQTNTWLACKIYFDLGFRPSPQSLIEHSFGWKIIEELTGRKTTIRI